MAESTTQMKLAVDPGFLARLQYVMVQQARVILAETGVGTNHAERANYAKLVIQFPSEYAAKAATMIVGGVNLINTVTVTPDPYSVTTTVTDAALLSQVATFWNSLASIDTGN